MKTNNLIMHENSTIEFCKSKHSALYDAILTTLFKNANDASCETIISVLSSVLNDVKRARNSVKLKDLWMNHTRIGGLEFKKDILVDAIDYGWKKNNEE